MRNTLVFTGKKNPAITKLEDITKLQQIAMGDSRWWRFTIERDGQRLDQVLRY